MATYPEWMVSGASVLFDKDMAEIFERAIYEGIYFAVQEKSIEGMLMKTNTLLADEQRLTDYIDVIQYPDSMAAKATSTADVFVVTVGKPATGTIMTHLYYSKAEYQPRVEKYPGLKAAIDIQCRNQLIERKNLELIKAVFTNKANAVPIASKGNLSYTDLLNLNQKVSDNGYRVTHFLTTHSLVASLLKDKDIHLTTNQMKIDPKGDEPEYAVYTVEGMQWQVVASKHMENTEVAGTNYCVAFNKSAYCQEPIREKPQARMYDKGDAGINMLRGTIWWEEYGAGPYPSSGTKAVAYTYAG